MCLSCGCLAPNESHGDPRHITLDALEAAAEANNTDVYTVLQNLEDGYYIFYQQVAEEESKKLAPKKKSEPSEDKTLPEMKPLAERLEREPYT